MRARLRRGHGLHVNRFVPFVAAFVIVAACGSYGDEDDHPLPNRNGSSSGSGGDAAVGTSSSSSGSSGTQVGLDGGGGDAGTGSPFCKTEPAKGAIRCLDFDANPSRPFGFDQVIGSPDNTHLAPSPVVNGNLGFLATSKALPTYGMFDSLPQDNAPLTIAFDVAIESLNGTPVIAAVVGAGTNCPIDQGSLGIVASAAGGDVAFSVTNFATGLGSVKLGTVVHFSLTASQRPGPGKSITTTIFRDGVSVQVPAKLPAGCQNFSAGVGSTIFSNGTATLTFDNVLLK